MKCGEWHLETLRRALRIMPLRRVGRAWRFRGRRNFSFFVASILIERGEAVRDGDLLKLVEGTCKTPQAQ